MNLATIDIGTNTTLLLVASAVGSKVEVLADRAEITRLGRGIGLAHLQIEHLGARFDDLADDRVIAASQQVADECLFPLALGPGLGRR